MVLFLTALYAEWRQRKTSLLMFSFAVFTLSCLQMLESFAGRNACQVFLLSQNDHAFVQPGNRRSTVLLCAQSLASTALQIGSVERCACVWAFYRLHF